MFAKLLKIFISPARLLECFSMSDKHIKKNCDMVAVTDEEYLHSRGCVDFCWNFINTHDKDQTPETKHTLRLLKITIEIFDGFVTRSYFDSTQNLSLEENFLFTLNII
jgi:hypothetical protein